jgi:hypothetical protein
MHCLLSDHVIVQLTLRGAEVYDDFRDNAGGYEFRYCQGVALTDGRWQFTHQALMRIFGPQLCNPDSAEPLFQGNRIDFVDATGDPLQKL